MKFSRIIGKYWYGYFIAIVCMIIAVGLDMIYPMITREIIDNVIGKGQMEKLAGLLVSIFLIGIGRAVFGYIKEYSFDIYGIKIASNLREDLFAHLQSLSMSYFGKTSTGELMARVKDDVDHILDGVTYVGMLLIEICIHITIVITCMVRLNAPLTLIPVGFMVVLGSVAVYMEKQLDAIYEEISEENARLTTVAEENIGGVRTVKAFAREKFEVEKFLSHNSKYYNLNMKQAKVMVRLQPLFQFSANAMPVLVVVVGGFAVGQGSLSLGGLVAFTQYARNSVWPMEMIGGLANECSSSIASYKKIKKVYEVEPEIQNPVHPVRKEQIQGEIEFCHVDFSMDGKGILKDVSFHVKPGETVGIMGETGSGKTSIVQLMQRFYDPDNGKVLLDGTDVRELLLKDIRGNIAMVMQDVFLFSETIEDNIKMGERKKLRTEDIREAARLARAEKFVLEMDEAYDTVVGERGVGLSGGQKQRLSIARALAKKKPILIMDDSTSALDMETEYEIQKALEGLEQQTKVIIAHRISAVRNANEILFLDKGQIVERGTHEELMSRKGKYYQTYQAQYAGKKEVI